MYLEPNGYRKGDMGWIEIICGSMFSGKTEELMLRVRRVRYANLKLQIFKPAVDTRYVENGIVSHDQRIEDAIVVSDSHSLLHTVQEDTQVVAIDEAQFFDTGLNLVCQTLANAGKRVIVAGLDMDYLGNPFGVMPTLLAEAEFVTKLHAVCVCCGALAQYTYRRSSSSDKVLIGAKDMYEPRCRTCYFKEKDAHHATY